VEEVWCSACGCGLEANCRVIGNLGPGAQISDVYPARLSTRPRVRAIPRQCTRSHLGSPLGESVFLGRQFEAKPVSKTQIASPSESIRASNRNPPQ